ncbi:MAG: hypothetical protein JNL26_09025, partial [Gemmatimonadetes bacterium]|nr:hypothetical protein [Gemmatimonadota bacterium]
DRSTTSGTNGFTDIMSIPPSVARRAYQAATEGKGSAFYYVRRFVSRTGAPDQFVAVTCRLTGGGARTPLAFTDVRIVPVDESPMVHVGQGTVPGPVEARLAYTGTGRLVGRWEVVLPGDELPSTDDLMTEASLPLEQRTQQRRYTQLSRFNVFLPPGAGPFTLAGPDPSRLPTLTEGTYYLLLRIEATGDKEGDTNLGAVGAGRGVLPTGGVAGFPMPVLRYVVGSGSAASPAVDLPRGQVRLLTPAAGEALAPARATFAWAAAATAAHYRLDIATDTGVVYTAIVAAPIASYRLPPVITEQLVAAHQQMRWRIAVMGPGGTSISRSAWRPFALAARPNQ